MIQLWLHLRTGFVTALPCSLWLRAIRHRAVVVCSLGLLGIAMLAIYSSSFFLFFFLPDVDDTPLLT